MNKKGIDTGYRGRAATRFKAGDERTKEAARNAAKAHSANVAKRKAMKEWAELIATIPCPSKAPDGSQVDTDLLGATVMAQYQKAVKEGNTQAFMALANILGEVVQKAEVTGVPAPVIVSNPDTAEKLKEIIAENGGSKEL